jgi:hypothetical protein
MPGASGRCPTNEVRPAGVNDMAAYLNCTPRMAQPLFEIGIVHVVSGQRRTFSNRAIAKADKMM